MEQRVDPVPAVRTYDAAFLGLGVFLDDVAGVAEGHAGFYDRDGLVETLSCSFDYADVVSVEGGGGADIVGFIEVSVEAIVVEGYVEVEDVAVEEEAGVGDAVADYFVNGGTEGFRKAIVVEGGRVGLW